MPSSKIPIPEEFQSKLRYVDALDKHSDAEILEALTKHRPVTSEKNVWTYWHSGVLSMPKWCQQNVINWVKLLGPSWTVRVLDKVPESPNYALSWFSADQLPECFIKGTMTGPYIGPHSADFLRGAALYTHGGVWLDVGCIMFRHLDKVCWDELADEKSPYTICAPWMFAQHIGNHFIAARKGDEFIAKWHELFMHFWKGRNDHTGIIESPLIAFVQNFKFEESEARGFKWNFAVDELTVLGYIGQVIAWIRCAWLMEPNGGFNGVEYYCNKVLLYDVLDEDWGAEKVVGFEGKDLFDVLITSREADPESEEYKKAYKCIWSLLTSSSIQKVTHGKGIIKNPALGVYLDDADRNGGVFGPKTFYELLRYGSVHFEQTREKIHYVKAIRPDEKVIIRKGLTEP